MFLQANLQDKAPACRTAPPWYDLRYSLQPSADSNEEFAETLSRHSLRAYCNGFNQNVDDVPQADTLVIQGVADTLFNMNESLDAFNACRRQDETAT